MSVCIVFNQLKTVVRFCTYFPLNIHKITVTRSGFPFQNATKTMASAMAPRQAPLGELIILPRPSCTWGSTGNEGKGWGIRVWVGGMKI